MINKSSRNRYFFLYILAIISVGNLLCWQQCVQIQMGKMALSNNHDQFVYHLSLVSTSENPIKVNAPFHEGKMATSSTNQNLKIVNVGLTKSRSLRMSSVCWLTYIPSDIVAWRSFINWMLRDNCFFFFFLLTCGHCLNWTSGIQQWFEMQWTACLCT